MLQRCVLLLFRSTASLREEVKVQDAGKKSRPTLDSSPRGVGTQVLVRVAHLCACPHQSSLELCSEDQQELSGRGCGWKLVRPRSAEKVTVRDSRPNLVLLHAAFKGYFTLAVS